MFASSSPVPIITFISPVSAAPGGAQFTLTVNGGNFVGPSVVRWSGTALATTFVSSAQLTATVPAAQIATNGTGWITVSNGINLVSNTIYFPVASALAGTSFPLTPVSVTVGTGPAGLVVGDFNNDGIVDIAVANYTDNTVSILLGDGNGGFTPKLPAVPVGMGPNWLVAGDFHKTGNLDLAVVNNLSNTVSILMGDGHGNFTVTSSPAVGTSPFAIAAGDFNGDGRLDLAVSNSGSGTVSILLGAAGGAFTAGDTLTVGTTPQVLVVGKFNEATTHLDIAVANDGTQNTPASWTVSMLLGTGNGHFASQTTTMTGGSGLPLGLIAGDFNQDGHLDVAAVNITDVALLFGNGSGGLSLNTNLAEGTLRSGTVLISGVAGDFNGHGYLDLAVTDQQFGDAYLFYGGAGGTFGAPTSYTVGAGTFDAATADFNGDGALDLAFTNMGASANGTTISIFLQTLPVALSPANLSFAGEPVGNSSAAQTVTVTNNSGSTLTVSSVTITGADSGDFSETTTCASVAHAASCPIHVTFTPTAAGSRTATLNVVDSATTSPQTLALTGTGTTAPIVDLSTSSVAFPNQPVSVASSSMPVVLSNTGNGNLTALAISIVGTNSGDFSQTSNCAATLTPAASCTINVTFTPTAGGARSASLQLTDNAANSPQLVTLSGTGVVAPAVGLSMPSLAFPNQLLHVASSSLPVTVTNTGNANLTSLSASIVGANIADFGQTNNCVVPLAPNATCTFNVTFTPQATGARSASLQLTDNAGNSPQSVTLSGTGIAPAVSLSTSSLSFANQLVHVASTSLPVVLTNTGTANLTMLSASIVGANIADFGQTNNCVVPLAPNATCTFNVTFTPQATGARSASLQLTDDAGNSPQSVTLSGTGIAPAVGLSTSSLSFANQNLHVASTSLPVVLTNTGTANLTMLSASIVGANIADFSQTNNCVVPLAPNATCTFNVIFTPQATGARSASLQLTDDAGNSPQSVTLSGTGIAPAVGLSTSSLSFANQLLHVASTSLPVVLTNTGTANLTMLSASIVGANIADFSQTNNCVVPLAPNATCTFNVIFTPQATGARSASLQLTDDAGNSPQSVTLSGTGIAPAVSLSTSSLSFANQLLHVASTSLPVVLTNTGTANLTMLSASIVGANIDDFSQTNNCVVPLAPNATCTFNIIFTPQATGARSASLQLNDNAGNSPQSVTLSGTGIAPAVGLSPSSLSFASQNLHVASTSLPVVLTNTGTANLTMLSASIVGANIDDFSQTNNCVVPLAPNATCTFNVIFTPQATGARSASLQLNDNAANTPQLVTLSGMGLSVPAKLAYGTAPPPSIMAGSSIGTITVDVEDMNSLLVTSSSASIQVLITGPNSFSQSLTQSAAAGIATFNFSAVPLATAGLYTVTASSTNLTSAISTTTVTAMLSSAQLVVAGYPATTYAGVPHTFTVSITDAFNNPLTGYTGTVTLTSTDPSAVLTPSPYTFVAADMGAHTFTATLATVGTQTISATDGSLSGAQGGIQVNARPQFIVNALPDDAGTSSCDGTSPCSLRSAIDQANRLGAGDITVNTSQFPGSAPFTSTLTNGVLELDSNLNITGPGVAELTISANNASSVLQVDSAATATVSGLTFAQGNSATNGGGITNAGALTLSNVAVTSSTAAQSGGGIYSTGSLTVNASTISGNTATANGGGVATSGTSVFFDSTLSGNSATGNGGGIDNDGALSAPQSTFSGNSAADGAAIENEIAGTLAVVQSTVSGNTATGTNAGAISNLNTNSGSVTITNSIVAGNNTSPGDDCLNCGTQSNSNLFDVAAAALKLAPLANNGGPTQTLLPLAGSPAIGAGSTSIALNPGLPQSLANDQRGAGFARIVNNSVDLGAVQYNSGAAASFTLVVTGSPTAGTPFTVTVNALTASGTPAGTYLGTIHFTSSDANAVLPGNYTFLPSDDGSHTFAFTLEASGSQTISVVDTVNPALNSVQSVADGSAAAASVTATAGSGQTATVSTLFATALAVKVTDAFGNPVSGVSVVFNAPSSGATGTFADDCDGNTAFVTTGSNGIATAPAFMANATTGQYSVSATVTGLTPATFALTNSVTPGFTLTANPNALTVAQGQSVSTVLTLTPVGSFSGTVALTCTGLPIGATCLFAPPQIVATGNDTVATSMLTVNTTGANGLRSQIASPGGPLHSMDSRSALAYLLLGILFVAVAPFLNAAARRYARAASVNHQYAKAFHTRLRYNYLAFLLIFAALAGAAIVGCSGGRRVAATPPGQYSITVVAGAAGSSSHSAVVTITITP